MVARDIYGKFPLAIHPPCSWKVGLKIAVLQELESRVVPLASPSAALGLLYKLAKDVPSKLEKTVAECDLEMGLAHALLRDCRHQICRLSSAITVQNEDLFYSNEQPLETIAHSTIKLESFVLSSSSLEPAIPEDNVFLAGIVREEEKEEG